MLEIREQLGRDHGAAASASLTLPYDARQKSRLRATLDDGREVGLFLARGTILRGGDRLRAVDGTVVAVVSAEESLSTVRSGDALALLKVAYHLGNRHVPVQIGEGWLRYQHDHVLDEMVRHLGLEARVERAGFEPEPGAYAPGGHHHHHHDHEHDHEHDHDHDHHRHDHELP